MRWDSLAQSYVSRRFLYFGGGEEHNGHDSATGIQTCPLGSSASVEVLSYQGVENWLGLIRIQVLAVFIHMEKLFKNCTRYFSALSRGILRCFACSQDLVNAI
jgi:hypothetical protein